MSDYECPKCKTEYDASGSHEDDSGEHECDECGFKFNVEIEYFPEYYSSCIECEYGELHMDTTRMNAGRIKRCKNCNHVVLECEVEDD